MSERDTGTTQPSDRSPVRRLTSASEDAATQIYLRYAQRLQALSRQQVAADLAGRVDAEDIVQSVFRTFFRRVQAEDYDVPDGEELWKLVLVIGLNKVRSAGTFHRAAKRDVRATSAMLNFSVRQISSRAAMRNHSLYCGWRLMKHSGLCRPDNATSFNSASKDIRSRRLPIYSVVQSVRSNGSCKGFENNSRS